MNLNEEIANMDPRVTYNGCCDGGTQCFFCGAEYEPHKATCLWLRENQSLGRHVNLDQNVNEDDEQYQWRKALETDIAVHGPIAPRQDVPTAFEATMASMATLFNREIYGQFTQQVASIEALSDAIGSQR